MPGKLLERKCLDDYLVLHPNSQNSNGIIKIWIHVFPALMNTLIENFCCGGYIYLHFSELQIKLTFPLIWQSFPRSIRHVAIAMSSKNWFGPVQ